MVDEAVELPGEGAGPETERPGGEGEGVRRKEKKQKTTIRV